MARPISMDLRERAMERLDRGQTVREVSAALDVAPSSVVKWSQRRRKTGSCPPCRPGGRRPRKISGEHEAWLLKRIKDAFTLRGLVGVSLPDEYSPIAPKQKSPVCGPAD